MGGKSSESSSNLEKEYKRIKFLGEGSYASVYQVQNRFTGSICAMKVIKKKFASSSTEEKEIRNEINILRMMDHPNILKLFEFYSNQKEFSIVTELCPLGEFIFYTKFFQLLIIAIKCTLFIVISNPKIF